MKKIKSSLIILALLFLSPGLVRAKGDLKRIYLGYRDHYFETYTSFLSTRATYWRQQTVKSKENFRKQSREFLVARNNWVLSYLDLLLSQSGFVSSENQQQLSHWQGWLNEHQKKVRQAYSLEELMTLNKELDEVYPEIEYSIYYFLLQRVINQQQQVVNDLKGLNQELAVLTTNDDWQNQVNQQIRQAQAVWAETEKAFEKIRIRRIGGTRDDWEEAVEDLAKAKSSLNQAVELLDEVISQNAKK